MARIGGGAIEFRGPAQALAALTCAALLAFGLPWAVRQDSGLIDTEPGPEPDPEAGSEGVVLGSAPGATKAALLGAALAVGVWLPFAALWARSYPAAQASWLGPVALGIAAASALRVLGAHGPSGQAPRARDAAPLLFALWVASACFILPGHPRWIGGAPEGALPGARGEWEIVEAEVDLTGPLITATVAYEGYPPLEIEADLIAGESKAVRAWIVAPRDRSFAAHERPDLVEAAPPNVGGVAVRPLGPSGALGSDPWAVQDRPNATDLLMERALPAMEASAGRIPVSAWLAAVTSALLLALVSLRFGASVAFAPVALAVGAGAAFFCRGGDAEVARQMEGVSRAANEAIAAVLEGRRLDGGGASWAMVERFSAPMVEALLAESATGSRAGASVGPDRETRLRLKDLRGPLRTGLSVLGGGPGLRWIEARGEDQPIDRLTAPVDPGLRLLMREVNTLGDFESSWARSADGTWSGGAPWAVGAAWDQGSSPSSEPPTWARAGLPMGVGIFVGRLSPSASQDLGLVGLSSPTLWVRLMGF